MIRLFSPSTLDPVFRRNAVTATNLLLHIAAGVLLFIPIQRGIREGLLERLVVYLVPPDAETSREKGAGEVPWHSASNDAGVPGGARAETISHDEIVSRGIVPTLQAEDLEAANRLLPGDNAMTVLEVDSTVLRDPTSAAPEYPRHLLEAGVEGVAAVRYVVDTLGNVDTLTYRVLATTHPDFAVAVRRALPAMHFRPAMSNGRRVRQLVEQPFRFRINSQDSTRRIITKPPV